MQRGLQYLGILVISSSLNGFNVSSEKFKVDPNIETILDAHSHEIVQAIHSMKHPRKKYRDGVWQFDWLPGYFIKYELARIPGYKRIKRCIKKYELNLLTLPQKQIYHIKGRPYDESNDNYVVIVNAIVPTSDPQPMTLEQVSQLSTLIRKTSYVDMTGTNYMQLSDGRLCIIDTEGAFDKNKLIRGYLRLIGTTHNLNTDYTQEALKYLFGEIKKIIVDDPSIAPFTFMQLEQYFAKQKRPLAWDYVTYCFELLKEFTPTRKEIERARSKAFYRS